MIKIMSPALALSALLIPMSQANAEQWRVRVGLGAQIQPDYPGADSTEILAYPEIAVARGDKPFSVGAHDDNLSIALISSGGFSFGPVAAISRKRRDSDVGAPVGDVGVSVEVGGFAQYYVSENFRIRGQLRKGIGGHEGLVGSIGADYVVRDADRYAFTVGPRVRFADSDYMDAYFGVTPQAALLTGLPVYNPDGGVRAIGAVTGFNYSLGGPFGLFGYGRYDRLVGDARKSPIVRQFGSPDQFSAGLGLSYAFAL